MQIVFLEEGQQYATLHGVDIIGNVNRLAAAVRNGGGRVLFTRHTATGSGPGALPQWRISTPQMKQALYDPFLAHLRQHEVDPRMDRHADDLTVDKYRPGAFAPHSSDADRRLREVGVDTLIITGVATNCCCETTAREASQLGYKTFVITDATATITDEEHNGALMSLGLFFADLRSTDQMLELIAAGRKAAGAHAAPSFSAASPGA